MEIEDITEVINMETTTEFLSGEKLVNLRKPEELAPQLNIGLKFSECKKAEAEKEAVECALDTQKAILAQKRGARICDLMQAEWSEELNVSIATKLKGKFVQHMGHKMDDKIALTPEESLLLLENGCLEVWNGKAPMSTEEAYAAMLKHKYGVEKYIVYSYLSQLGFIVVPHKKELKNKLQSKISAERNKKKRKNQSPLPDDSRNKRLTFSGAFSEESDIAKNLKIAAESISLLKDIALISKRSGLLSTEIECELSESKKTDANNEDQLQSNCSDIILSPPCNNLENSKTDADVEIELDVDESSSVKPAELNVDESSSGKLAELDVDGFSPVKPSELDVDESSSVKPSLSASAADIDVDSQSTDVLLDSLEKSTGVFVADTGEGSHIDATTQSSDSQCAVINDTSDMDDQNSEVLSCSSYDYNELENSGDENTRGNLIADDDITLVEITKKETTPLAVIDLLSDEDEMQTDVLNAQDESESDDDIKILEVCNGSTNSNKNSTIPLNLNKIKSQKMENCKREQTNVHTVQNTAPTIQFPELFRKDLVCVARPYANLLPLHVQPLKEVYILDCSKLQQTSRGGHQSAMAQQPQGRVWNSFRDMQDYQRSLRRNRPFNRFPNQNRSWQRGFRSHEEGSYRRPTPYHNNSNNNNLVPSRDQKNDIVRPDRNFSHARHGDMGYREHNTSRNQHSDVDYRNHNGSEDQKPFISSRTPAFLHDVPRPNPGDSFPLRVPPLSNPNSMPVRLPMPNFPLGNSSLNPLDLNNSSGGMSSLTSQEFVAEVHRTAYSYATNMLSSMFGSAFNANNFSPLAPFQTIRHGPPFGMPQPISLIDASNSRNLSSSFANEYYPLPNRGHLQGDFPRNRRHHRTEPFPCHYRNIQNKKSWNDVKAAVGGEKEQSDSESSDIEEIPINVNEFLWNASNICPLVKPGIKHPLADVLSPLKMTHLARLTDKTCRNEKYFSDNQMLEIAFDVYKPGTHFKKSSPGIPNLRIIIMRASDPVPRYSEIALLQRKWSDGAALQIAVVDNADVSFYSFTSICIPDIVPFQD